MGSYVEVVKQIRELTKHAEKLRRAELADVIRRIKLEIATYGLTASDLGLGLAPTENSSSGAIRKQKGRSFRSNSKSTSPKARRVVPPKFRDEVGNTWSGRGKTPKWFRMAIESGSSVESLRIKEM